MRTLAWIFTIVGVFFLITFSAYTFIGMNAPAGIEWVGTPAILALAGLMFMTAVYLFLVTRTHKHQAQDWHAGDVPDEAGVQGTFSPHSWAPLWTSLGASIVFVGLPIGWWLMALGFIVAFYGLISWVMHYSIGFHSH